MRGGAGDAGRLGALGLKGSALRLDRGQLLATRSDRCVTGLAERARRGPPAQPQTTQGLGIRSEGWPSARAVARLRKPSPLSSCTYFVSYAPAL